VFSLTPRCKYAHSQPQTRIHNLQDVLETQRSAPSFCFLSFSDFSSPYLYYSPAGGIALNEDARTVPLSTEMGHWRGGGEKGGNANIKVTAHPRGGSRERNTSRQCSGHAPGCDSNDHFGCRRASRCNGNHRRHQLSTSHRDHGRDYPGC